MKRQTIIILAWAFIVLLLALPVRAQFNFTYNDSIPVLALSDTLRFPWAGGLNYVQISDFDYDMDGDADLFVFDRSSNNIRVFTQETSVNGSAYSFVFNAAQYFPELRYRAQMIDYDNDGRKDIFTWGLGGLKVYRNVSDAGNGLQWALFKDIVYSEYPNGTAFLSISSSDIPAIVDVDFDGDIDVITTDPLGARLEYHRNFSMENYGIPDSLEFIQKNECWGKFSESPTSSVLILNDPNPPCTGGSIPNPESWSDSTGGALRSGMHSGATILGIDIDSSGVLDLILGDETYNNLTLTINGGTSVNSDSPMISFDDAFPSYTTAVKCNLFPAAFYVDVDFDGKKDLLASPNATLVSFNQASVIFYKNLGTNGLPIFTPVTNNFLQSEMIEHGRGSIPVIVDYNEDGLKDLLVANFYRYKPVDDRESTVAYYQNTGTSNTPQFTFVDNDVFSLSQENYGLRTVPAFGDVDGDGDQDLYYGLENGTLVYRENLSSGSGPVWGVPQNFVTDNASDTIDVGSYAFPQLFDLNLDGLLDLLIGNAEGLIHYYRNVGNVSAPQFVLQNDFLGNVNPDQVSPSERIAPHFFRSNGTTHLFAGSISGQLYYYDNIDANLSPGLPFDLVSDDYLDLDAGAWSAFWAEDLNADGRLELFVGQDLGGISHYEINPSTAGSPSELSSMHAALFPNPVRGYVTLQSDENIEEIRILDINGREIDRLQVKGNKIVWDTAGYGSGMYLVEIHSQKGHLSRKKLIIE